MTLFFSLFCQSWKRKSSIFSFSSHRFVFHSHLQQSNYHLDAKNSNDFPLNLQNQHPHDQWIEFNTIDHTYTYQQQPLKTSVTQLVHSYFEKFAKEEIALNMMNSFNWPRPEYTHPTGEPFTYEEILAQWENISEKARNEGTSMHQAIECLIHGDAIPPTTTTSLPTKEIQQFQNFVTEYLHKEKIQPYRTEWKIVAPNIRLAGSVDFVGRLPDNSFILMDWKRSKNAQLFFQYNNNNNPASPLPTSSSSSPSSLSPSGYVPTKGNMKKAKKPINHLFDCDEIKYSLQLNFYSYILSNYYNLNISKMMIVAFHPQLPNYVAVEAPKLTNEVHEIICDHISKL